MHASVPKLRWLALFLLSRATCLPADVSHPPPQIIVQPQAQTVPAGIDVRFQVKAVGPPPLNYQWRVNGNPIAGATNSLLLISHAQCPDAGNYSVVVNDRKGGSVTSIDAMLDVFDHTPPTITCPPDLMLQCLNEVPAPNLSSVSAADNSGSVSVTYLGDVFQTNGPEVKITRTYQAIDPCTNMAVCTQTIRVRDTTPPALICGPDRTVQCGSPVFNEPSASDNCDPQPIIQVLGDSIIINPSTGDEIRTRCWEATDRSGNSSMCCQSITVPPDAPCATLSNIVVIRYINLGRGTPGLSSGTTNSALAPMVATPCGQSGAGALFFYFPSRDAGPVSIQGMGLSLLVILTGDLSSPTNLSQVACCAAPNGQCRVQFLAQPTNYLLLADGVTNGSQLQLIYGFDPAIGVEGFTPDGLLALRSTLAPALPYTLQGSADLSHWTDLATTNFPVGGTTNRFITYTDAMTRDYRQRFYRIVPGR